MRFAFCLAVASSLFGANIVQNPGFETGSFAPWVANGSSSFPWGVSTAAPFSGQFYAETGCVGAQCIANDTHSGGAWLYQDLTTTATTYTLSFEYFPAGGTPNELSVLWGGTQVLDLVNLGTGSTYNLYTVTGLVGNAGTTRLEFLGRQDPSFLGLDNVCASTSSDCGAAPEPATLFTLGGGFSGLGLLALGRRFVLNRLNR